jgi:hypothetical protein
MANNVFDIKTDLSIRYYNASISSYVEIVADSFEIDIDRGINVEDEVFARASVGTATVKLVKSSLSDFLGTPGYKANDYFEIRYKPSPDSAPSIYNYLFSGYIQNVSMNYINESGTLQIEITANDVMKTFLNTQLATFAISGTTTQRSFRNCIINLNTAINASVTWPSLFPLGIDLVPAGSGGSSTVQRISPTYLNVVSGTLSSQYMDAELGWLWASYAPNKVQYLTRTDVAALRAIAFTTGNSTVSNVHYTNLITNGNFDVNTAGWVTGAGTPTMTRTTAQFYMSPASMFIESNPSPAEYNISTNTTMTVAPFDKVKGSFWAKVNSNTSDAKVIVTFYNSGGTSLGSISSPFVLLNGTNWTEVAITGVAPANTVRAVMTVVGKKGGFTGAASMYMDNAKLENLTNISTNHYCLDNITLRYDSDLLVNKVKVTEALTPTPATASNTASITANGEQTGQYNVEYDVSGSPTTLANLATRIANSATIKQVSQVSVPVIRDDGTVSGVESYDIGYTIQVEFAQDPLPPLQVVTLVSRINHIITPQHWEMNIGLWRGI